MATTKSAPRADSVTAAPDTSLTSENKDAKPKFTEKEVGRTSPLSHLPSCSPLPFNSSSFYLNPDHHCTCQTAEHAH
jgi:hypothetical protein